MKNKYYYYVAVCSNNEARLVTKMDNATKYAHWNRDDKPLELGKSNAENLAYCLNLNFFPAFVLQSYYKIESQIFCRKEEDDENTNENPV